MDKEEARQEETQESSVWDRIQPEEDREAILTLEEFEAVLLDVATPEEE